MRQLNFLLIVSDLFGHPLQSLIVYIQVIVPFPVNIKFFLRLLSLWFCGSCSIFCSVHTISWDVDGIAWNSHISIKRLFANLIVYLLMQSHLQVNMRGGLSPLNHRLLFGNGFKPFANIEQNLVLRFWHFLGDWFHDNFRVNVCWWVVLIHQKFRWLHKVSFQKHF